MEASGVIRRLEAYCAREGFPLDGRRVLCAVSGGVDSMVLLWLLQALGSCDLTAATFDHCLRPGSARDADFVADWCRERGIPCRMGRGDVADYARTSGETVEEAARTLRYRFLESTADQIGADYIATAHHADDNAETVLLHLLRGSGLKGLGGIPPRRGRIVRPLLWLTRREIAALAAEQAIPFREDESNADPAYTRNFLRHQVMPLLEQVNPGVSRTLCRTARTLRRDEECLSELTREAAQSCHEGTIAARTLLDLPPAVALRLVQTMAEQAGSGCALPQSQREAVLALAGGEDPSARLSLSGELIARRQYELLVLERETDPTGTFAPVTLGDGEQAELPALGVTVHCRRLERLEAEEPGRLYLAGAGERITLRPRAQGDEICLPKRGRKRIKKWMIEERVPRARRDLIPVVTIEDRPAALWGMGRDETFLPGPGEPVWELWMERKGADHEESGSGH